MSKKDRKDFVKIIPAEGLGSVNLVSGRLAVHCTPDEPAEVTRAEWEILLKKRGKFQLFEASEAIIANEESANNERTN